MDSERWRRVDEVLQIILDLPPAERDDALRSACGCDDDLEREVRSLLTSDRRAGGFLGRPAIEVAARMLASADHAPDSLLGQAISHYRIVAQLGRGGMGQVYRAEDVRLRRSVAIKFLSDEFARDPQALSRFRREAQAASALNHPNICTIYDIGEDNGRPFIVMEHLEGSSLSDRLAAGKLDEGTAIALAIEIADGLEAAHRAGIVHRDIKPTNILISAGDHAKILDFGLAQLASDEQMTHPGTVVGTARYMSPEQARGEPADARSDLYSFGLVLHEMAIGERPSAGMERIVSRCLEQAPEKRYTRAAEIAAALRQLQSGGSRTSKQKLLLAAIVLVIVAGAAAAYLWPRPSPKLTDNDTIVLAEFDNKTGDPVFDGSIRQGLVVELGQSPFLSIVSDERIHHTLQLMGRNAGTRLTPELAREICERTGSAAVVEGSIALLGSQYLLGFRVRNCSGGNDLYAEQVQASRKEDVINLLHQVASRFRTRAGESLATVRKHSLSISEATTTSLEAWKAYSEALRSVFSPSTMPLVKRAIEIDPEFAMAHAFLGRIYADNWESGLARKSFRRAYELRDRTSDRERFFISANYEFQVVGNLHKATQTCELWASTYPRDPEVRALLSGINQSFGKYETAAENASKAIELDPYFIPGYLNLGWAHVLLDRPDEALKVLAVARDRKLEAGEMLIMRYYIAFLKDDQAGMRQLAAQASLRPDAEDWMSHAQSGVLASSGELQEARKFSRKAVELARQANNRERAAMYEAGESVREAFFGNAAEARRAAAAALALSDTRDVKWGAALAFALAGDFAKSAVLTAELEKRFPEDTDVRFAYLPELKALASIHNGQPRHAVDVLQTAAPFDLAITGSWSGFFGNLYPPYIRGAALLADHRPAEAAAEFEKILQHPGIAFSDPVVAVARVQLARAYTAAGKLAKAKAAYQDFLARWRQADPQTPLLKRAAAEYARLD
jgi:tetratricopeptide (TPR) repeat protein/predicted Ser/Thr protein kinase